MTNAADGINWVKISDATASGKYIYTTAEKIKPAGAIRSRVVADGDFLLSNSMSFGRPYIMRTAGCVHDGWLVLSKYQESFSADFLYHLLGSPQVFNQFDRLAAGSTVRNLNIDLASRVLVPVPPLVEQQRIVAILDEAFEGIATAKANAQNNFQNCLDLFEGYLRTVFALTGATTSLAECASSISDGDHAPPPKSATGIPFITISNVDKESRRINLRDTFMVSREYFDSLKSHRKPRRGDILYTVTGSFGIPVLVEDETEFCFQRHIGLIRPNDDVDSQWLAYALLSPQVRAQAEAGATGTAQRTVSLGVLRGIKVPKIGLDAQRAIATKIDTFERQCRRIGSIARAKIAALEELKRSLLYLAFSGQLFSSEKSSIAHPLPLQTTVPEFTADVISLAYARHERSKREKTFGRVKEQKTLHLVEAIAGIDLGRRPMRDAAGPNDFQHMLKAEEWAKDHAFFEMVKTGEGYEFRKLSKFDEQMSRARHALAPYLPRIEPVFDLLVPMDTEEAEVFATVHAAWNNLLIDGAQTTDDAIVLAARQEWHPDKVRIPEHKFRSAIEKTRQKKLIPDGSAKYVGGQKALFDRAV